MAETAVRPSYPLVRVQSTREVGRPAVPWGVAAELTGVDGSLQGGLRPFQGFEKVYELDFYNHALHDETSRVNYFKPIHFRVGSNHYGYGFVYRAVRTRRLGGSTSSNASVSTTSGTGSHSFSTGADLGSSTSSGNPHGVSGKADIFIDFWNSATDSRTAFGHAGEILVEGVDPEAQMDVVVVGRLVYIFVSGRDPALFYIEAVDAVQSVGSVTSSVSGSTSSGQSSVAASYTIRKLGRTLAGPFPGPGRQPLCISPHNATPLGELPVPQAAVLHRRPAVGQVVLTSVGPALSGLFSTDVIGEGGTESLSGRGSSVFIDSTGIGGTPTSSSFPDTTAYFPNPDYSGWVYDITAPTAPTTNKNISLTNPTVEEIQEAIATSGGSCTISVFGTVTDITSQLSITQDNVILDMTGTSGTMVWAGSQFGGHSGAVFLHIAGQFVQVKGLDFNGAGGSIGGIHVDQGSADIMIDDCAFDECFSSRTSDSTRVRFLRTSITKAQRSSLDGLGGYGMYLENISSGVTHWEAKNCTFSTTGNSAEYPFRSEVGNSDIRLIDSTISQLSSKRSAWFYGITRLQLTRVTFIGKRVKLGSNSQDGVGLGYVRGCRIDQCIFQDILPEGPNEGNLQINCTYIAEDIKIRLCHWNNCQGAWRISIEWRDDPASGSASRDINWYPHTLRVNGGPFTTADADVDGDWSSPGEPTSYNIQAIEGGAGSSSFTDSTSGLVSVMGGNSSDETSTSSSMIGGLSSTVIRTSSSGDAGEYDSTGLTSSSSSISISQTPPTISPYSDPTSACNNTSGTASVGTTPPRILASAWVQSPRPFFPAAGGAPATGIQNLQAATVVVSVNGRSRGDEDPWGLLQAGVNRRAHIQNWELYVADLDAYAQNPGVLDTPVATGTLPGLLGQLTLSLPIGLYVTLQPGHTYLWGLRLFNANTQCGILVGNADEAINAGGSTIVQPGMSQEAFIDNIVGGKYKFHIADENPQNTSPSSDDPGPALGKFRAEKFEPGDYVFGYYLYDSKTGRKSAFSEVAQVREETFTTVAGVTSELSEDRAALYAVMELAYDPGKFDQAYIFRSVKVQDAGGTLTARNQHLEAIIDLADYHTAKNQSGGQWFGQTYKHVCYWYKIEDKQLIYQDMYIDEPLFDESMPKGGAAAFYANTMFVSKINDAGPFSTVDAVRIDDAIRGVGETRWSSTFNFSPELFSPRGRYVPSVPTSEIISFQQSGNNLIGFALDRLYHIRREGDFVKPQPMHEGYGIVSQKALAANGSAVYYMTPKGLKMVTSNGELSDISVMDYQVVTDWAGQHSRISMAYDPLLSTLMVLNPEAEEVSCIWMNTLMFTQVKDAVFTEVEGGVWPATYTDFSSNLSPRALFLQNSPGTTANDIVPGFKPKVYLVDHDRSRTVGVGANDEGSARHTTLDVQGNIRLTTAAPTSGRVNINSVDGSLTTGTSLCGAYLYVMDSTTASYIGLKVKIVEVVSSTSLRMASTALDGLPAGSRVGISPVFFQWVGANVPLLSTSGAQYEGAEFNRVRHLHALGCSFVDVEVPLEGGEGQSGGQTDFPSDMKFEGLAFRGTSTSPYATGFGRDGSGTLIRTVEDFESIDWAPFGWSASDTAALGVRGTSISPGVRIYCPDLDYRLLSVVVHATILDTERGQMGT